MSKFHDEIAKLKEESSSTAFSKTTLDKLSNALINDVDYVQKSYQRKGDSFEVKESYPVKDFRNGLKAFVTKELGVDEAEAAKLDTCHFNDKVSTPIGEMAAPLVKGVMKTGKSFKFAPETESETVMQISLREMPAKDVETKKPEKQADGSVIQVPTGDKVHYTERTEIVGSNKHLPTTRYKL